MKATLIFSRSVCSSVPTRAARACGLLLALLLAFAPAPLEARTQRRADNRAAQAGATSQTGRDERSPARRGTRGATPASSTIEAGERPRLVLVIVVDQFRHEYLQRFGDLFGAGGLRRLEREGASWSNANYDHIPTETAPGHATIMTGAWPAETGIIANDWYDRARSRRINNVEDETARLIGGGEKERAASPRALLASTIGDELKLMSGGRSKVVGLSIKDRGAILPAGRMADGAFWYSTATGQFVSSTYYFNQLPEWVARYNATRPSDRYLNAKWERLLPAAEYERRAGADAAPWEKGDGRINYVFPYTFAGAAGKPDANFYQSLLYSPFTNDMLVELAELAIVNEHLGADADPDVLSVSLSANDYVGHRYGPYSHETMDMVVRTDRQIERLLNIVEARVGLRNTIVAFTADHGVAPVPEQANELRLPGGRIRRADLLAAINNRLRARYGKGGERDNTADYILIYSNGQLYFNQTALERDGLRAEEVERVAGEAALTVPGIARYFTRTQLQNGAISPADPVARRALHGYHPGRSGDVIIIQEPYKYLTEYSGASHGLPYSYDTHVPVIIMGGGLTAGRYRQAATPADIAPTLAQLLRVQPPSNAVGRVLAEALR
jgi:predicted AlkP superfamily pyrophosphatase or phosphodiesterase